MCRRLRDSSVSRSRLRYGHFRSVLICATAGASGWPMSWWWRSAVFLPRLRRWDRAARGPVIRNSRASAWSAWTLPTRPRLSWACPAVRCMCWSGGGGRVKASCRPAAWYFQRRARRRTAAGRGGGRGPGGSADPLPDAAAADGGLGLPGDHTRVQGPRPPGAVAGNGAAPDRHARPGEDDVGREGRDAARALKSAGGVPPEITELLEQVQADHTPIDVIVVDEKHRLTVGPRTSRSRSTCAQGACSAWW